MGISIFFKYLLWPIKQFLKQDFTIYLGTPIRSWHVFDKWLKKLSKIAWRKFQTLIITLQKYKVQCHSHYMYYIVYFKVDTSGKIVQWKMCVKVFVYLPQTKKSTFFWKIFFFPQGSFGAPYVEFFKNCWF